MPPKKEKQRARKKATKTAKTTGPVQEGGLRGPVVEGGLKGPSQEGSLREPPDAGQMDHAQYRNLLREVDHHHKAELERLQIPGSNEMTLQFIDDYLQNNISDINPDLLP